MIKLIVGLIALLVAAPVAGDSVTAMLQRTADSTVQIVVEDGFGSGVVVGPNLVLTCEHVVRGDKDIFVVSTNAKREQALYPAAVLKADKSRDIALLITMKPMGLPIAKVAKVDPVEFEQLWSITAPAARPRTAAPEFYEGPDSEVPWLWRLNGFSYGGSSGGGVFNAAGELECLVKAVWKETTSMVWCVGRESVAEFLTPKK